MNMRNESKLYANKYINRTQIKYYNELERNTSEIGKSASRAKLFTH